MLIASDGSYIQTTFTGSNGKWHLIGSESNGSVIETLDTFSNGKGEFVTVKRSAIQQWYQEKKIWL